MKKNKKGFTLIELLAVIAILAILIIIAVPAVIKVFQSSTKQAFVTQSQSLFKAAEQQVITNQINGAGVPTQFCYIYDDETESSLVGSGTVDLDGTKRLSYKIALTDGKITSFQISNKDYSLTEAGVELTVSDIEEIDSPRAAVTSCD